MEVIAYALQTSPDVPLRDVIMVGDREHDIKGAAEAGISSLGVTYGYGSREELASAGATYIADSPEDVLKHFS